MNPTTSLLTSRTSVRKYKGNLSREEVVELVRIAQCAATSNFRQAYSIVWVTDEAAKIKLGELAVNVLQYTTCGAAFVICADLHKLGIACKMHGKTIKNDNFENLFITCVDATLFASALTTAAEAKGYGACFIGGVRTNIAPIDTLLGLPDHVFPLFGVTIGVPDAPLNEVKPRLPVEAVLFENKYGNDADLEETFKKYDEEMNHYFKYRSSNVRDATWTSDMATAMSVNKRPFIKSYLESKGFTLPE